MTNMAAPIATKALVRDPAMRWARLTLSTDQRSQGESRCQIDCKLGPVDRETPAVSMD